jgi:DinB family protein
MSILLIALSWITLVAAEPPQPAAQQQLRSSQVVEFFVAFLERQLVQAADAMPADKYSFAPTVGEFKSVRTFGQQVKHLAATNYMLAAGALGERPPDDAGDETGPADLRMKADILGYLRGSFRALHRAAAAIDDSNAVVGDVPISPLTGQATRLGYVLEALLHTYDHYGQMVIYLRMNGVVPPASRNR